MDKASFDGLARRLSTERNRRDALRVAGTGLIAGLVPGLFVGGEADAAELSGKACSPVGTKCGRRRRGKGPKARRRQQPACKKCCTGHTIKQRNGQRRCSCIPDLSVKTCQRNDQCCSGLCRRIEDLCDPQDLECEPPDEFPFRPGTKICVPGILNLFPVI